MKTLSSETFSRGLREGYWFCDHEGRVITLPVEETDSQFGETCPHCHRRTAAWHPPILPLVKLDCGLHYGKGGRCAKCDAGITARDIAQSRNRALIAAITPIDL